MQLSRWLKTSLLLPYQVVCSLWEQPIEASLHILLVIFINKICGKGVWSNLAKIWQSDV